MKRVNRGYWVATALVAAVMGAGGIMDLMRAPEILATLSRLGYPPYLATMLGVAKLLGAVAILVPGRARLKEWAYAGIVFDLGGAALSHLWVGDPAGDVLIPVALLGLAVTSWALRPGSRKLRAQTGDGAWGPQENGHVAPRVEASA